MPRMWSEPFINGPVDQTVLDSIRFYMFYYIVAKYM